MVSIFVAQTLVLNSHIRTRAHIAQIANLFEIAPVERLPWIPVNMCWPGGMWLVSDKFLVGRTCCPRNRILREGWAGADSKSAFHEKNTDGPMECGLLMCSAGRFACPLAQEDVALGFHCFADSQEVCACVRVWVTEV